MDQVKIGKFIQDCRKKLGLTQSKLAEKLGISDKAVSKWERGISMPDASIMLSLCDKFGISVNELLNGEKSNDDDTTNNNEKVLLQLAKELEAKNRLVWKSMWLLLAVSGLLLIGGLSVSIFLIKEEFWQLITVIGTCIIFLIPALYSLSLEVSVGVYQCGNCAHDIVPSYFQALNAMHIGTTRYLKCDACKKRSWSKKVL